MIPVATQALIPIACKACIAELMNVLIRSVNYKVHATITAQIVLRFKVSETFTSLCGIPIEARIGTSSCSNLSTCLLFFGDCREHAQVVRARIARLLSNPTGVMVVQCLGAFGYWQKYHFDKHVLSMYDRVGENSDAFAEGLVRAKQLLQVELRGCVKQTGHATKRITRVLQVHMSPFSRLFGWLPPTTLRGKMNL